MSRQIFSLRAPSIPKKERINITEPTAMKMIVKSKKISNTSLDSFIFVFVFMSLVTKKAHIPIAIRISPHICI